jgi:hypothetical protein
MNVLTVSALPGIFDGVPKRFIAGNGSPVNFILGHAISDCRSSVFRSASRHLTTGLTTNFRNAEIDAAGGIEPPVEELIEAEGGLRPSHV